MINPEFNATSLADDGANAPKSKHQIVNYVWLNRYNGKNKNSEALCDVPLHYFDRAFENARRYPNAEFNIWIDYSLLDPATRFFVDTHQYLNAPENVRYRGIQDIPEYNENEYFSSGRDTIDGLEHVWCRVDFARFIVVSHCLKTTDAQQVFYADFDLEDVELANEKTKALLDSQGYAFGKLPHRNVISHGYIVFDREGQSYLDEVLIPKFKAEPDWLFDILEEELLGIKPGYDDPALRAFKIAQICTNVPILPDGHTMPRDPLYGAETMLCELSHR